jgi:hydroxyacylglutathione hydrolase
MIFKQFYLESLGHASYLIGSEDTGEALVLDVRRDVDIYFAEARRQGLRLRYAVDTHQHNDYLTGICELPARGEVQLLAAARAELGYAARRLSDRERLEMGEVVVEVVHTPGHTPEHISLLVTDRSRGEEPTLLLSGGSLLVGDVGRPDLLGGPEQAAEQARALRRTLEATILPLPDYVEVYPTHVAGSLCGGSIGRRLSTTIGYERRLSRLLGCLRAEEDFLDRCLKVQELPAVPPYWRRMRQLNQQGPRPLGTLAEPPALSVSAFERWRHEGAVVLDFRPPEAFAAHIPGALNVGLDAAFPTWAGTVLPPNVPILLVLDRADELWEVCWHLLRIGYELPQGWLAGGMHAWRTAAKELVMLPQWTVWELHDHLRRDGELTVVDVRQPQEWRAGHIDDAQHITGAELPARVDEVPSERPVAVICGSGYRSSVAASLLQQRGYRQVMNVLGGMSAWKRAELPTVTSHDQGV